MVIIHENNNEKHAIRLVAREQDTKEKILASFIFNLRLTVIQFITSAVNAGAFHLSCELDLAVRLPRGSCFNDLESLSEIYRDLAGSFPMARISIKKVDFSCQNISSEEIKSLDNYGNCTHTISIRFDPPAIQPRLISVDDVPYLLDKQVFENLVYKSQINQLSLTTSAINCAKYQLELGTQLQFTALCDKPGLMIAPIIDAYPNASIEILSIPGGRSVIVSL